MKTNFTRHTYKSDLTKSIKLRTLPFRLIKMKIFNFLVTTVFFDMIGFNRLGNTVGKHIDSAFFNQKADVSVKLQMIQFMLKRGKTARTKSLFKQIRKLNYQKDDNRLNLYLQKSGPRSHRRKLENNI